MLLNISRMRIVSLLLIVLMSIGFAGYGIYRDGGVSERLIRTKSGLLAYSAMKKSTNEANRYCPLTISVSNVFEINCIAHLNPHASKTVVVWGDSHAQSWLPAFESIAHENDLQLYVLAHHSCPPIEGVRRTDGLTALPCLNTGSMAPIMKDIIRLQPQAVVLIARWSLYANGWVKEGRPQEATHFLTANETGQATLATSQSALERNIPSTINRLSNAGIKVLVIQNPPVLNFDVFNPRKTKEQIQVNAAGYQQQNQFIDHLFLELKQAYFLDSSRKFCPSTLSQCITEQGGKVLYRDDNHISQDGAYWFTEDVQRILQTMKVLP